MWILVSVFIGVLFVQFSCTSKPSLKENFLDYFTTEKSLKCEVSYPIEMLRASDMLIVDSLILFNVSGTTHNLFVYDTKGSLKNKLISFGKSANEVIWLNDKIIIHNDKITMGDPQKQEIIELSKETILNPETIINKITLNPACGLSITSFAPVSNDRYLFFTIMDQENSTLFMTDSALNIINKFEELAIDDKQETNSLLKKMSIGTVRITPTPNGENFMFSSGGNVFKFYDCSDRTKNPEKLAAYCYDLPKVEKIRNDGDVNLSFNSDNKIGALSTTSNKEFYFALYTESASETASNTVLVFNIKGDAETKFILDRRVKLIAWSEADHLLYALSSDENGDDLLVKYQL